MTEKPSECDVQDTAFSESAERTTNIMEVCESDAGTPSGSNTNTASIKIKLEETDTADNIKDFDIATVNIKAELPSASEIDNVQIKQENYGDSESEEEMDIKSEGEDYEDIDDGLLTSKTSMNVTDIDLKDHVKKEIDECEISDEGDFESGINDGVKIEDETVVKYLHSEFDEKFSSCEHSDEDYQSYCTKCRMLVYILDNNVPNNTDDKAIEEIPKDILEIRQSPEHSGIFALKTIPEGVRFGPFMGVNSSDNTWKIKGGKFVVNDENVKFLNWMQHINPAKNILEHNLFPFEHEGNIYYRSMCEIQEGEELLMYFGVEYEDSLNNDVEVKFMPHPETNVEDVFACTLCCLGFNSAIYLAKHKTMCLNKTEGSFLSKDIMQCPHCKIYLEQWEYLEHHMTYCREKNYRRKLKYAAVSREGDEEVDLEDSKRSIFTPSCVRATLSTAVLLCTYFASSIILTFYQRWLFQKFKFPLCTVLVHLAVKFILSFIWRTCKACKQGKPSVAVAFKDNIVSIAPTGVFSGIDIGFSNWGLELITVSLYTMTKSTTIIFILGFAILFKLEKKTWSLCFIVIMISLGLLLFTYKSTQFNIFGFTLLIIASMSSGLRWTCIQLLLQKSKLGLKDPVDMIYFMQPWMFASVLPFALWIEGPRTFEKISIFPSEDYSQYLILLAKVLGGAFIAFFMEISEVLVVTYTSSLTLSIAGIAKEILILVLAVLWTGDRMSFVNVIGLAVCLGGIISHVIHKIRYVQQTHNHSTRSYELEIDKDEMGKSLMEVAPTTYLLSDSEGEQNDSMDLFNILNRHDR